ncbi:MAG: valine--tRNA ligase [Candidatus Kerfeldbacteria bacterium]
MEKAYDPKQYEDDIYKKWEDSGYFNPDNLPGDRTEPFSVMMPPPNVTGVLHLGHAFEHSLMDTKVRFERMRGKKALLLPGTDHAAIATQARVEDKLKKEGVENPRQEYGREKLLEIIREFAEESKATMLGQIRRIGTSCDWSRLAYTFDEDRSRAVNAMFKKMYDDGLIYRGYRVVNWSVAGQSTCSEDELEYKEQPTTIYTFKYSKDFPIAIASTRPETKLGDTAVAVHPEDKRYKKFIGEEFTVDVGAATPLTIKIIADESVDPEYGTGALGVTPAHSAIDFEMYERNKEIGLNQVIGTDGRMTDNAGKAYKGLTTEEARAKFVQWLRDQKLLVNEEEAMHSVGASDRYKDVVEALPMDQWFVDVNKEIPGRGKSLKELMKDAVTTGHNGDKSKKVEIAPEQFLKTYLHWIENLKDWCISRQIWWGHRIPVWTKGEDVHVGAEAPEGGGWTQDEDTLDTWFSSGMWAFSTLGWPEETIDLQTFFPTSWMQMGYEILFLWLARMILMSTYGLDDIPFTQAHIHGILRDKRGKKFSKTAGNGVDPIEMANKYGTDALRFSLLKGIAPGNDSRFYEEKVEDGRNFVNKLWNMARFISMQEIDEAGKPSIADRWILSRLNAVIREVEQMYENDQFGQAADTLYNFTWHEFADWYIEITKVQPNPAVTRDVLEQIIKLAHPLIPFVTEAIWKELGKESMLIIEQWPEADESLIDNAAEKQLEDVKELISSIRHIRKEYNIKPKQELEALKSDIDDEDAALVQQLASVSFVAEKKFTNSATAVAGDKQIIIPLDGVIDVEAEKKRIEREIKAKEGYLAGLEKKLGNKKFLESAPEEVIEQNKQSKAEAEAELSNLQQALANLS